MFKLTHWQSKSLSVVHKVPTQPDVVCNRTLVHPFPPAWTSGFCKRTVFSGSRQWFALCLACFTSTILPLGRLFGSVHLAAERACMSWCHFIPVLPATSKPSMIPSKAASCYRQMESVAGCCAEKRQRGPISTGSVTPYPTTHWLFSGKARLFLLVRSRYRTTVPLTDTARGRY